MRTNVRHALNDVEVRPIVVSYAVAHDTAEAAP
jgi:hypothetical protein